MPGKILVVDDERPIADILKFNLEKEGYEVICAFDGGEAVQLAFEHDPDLILLDLMLPVKDGMDVCREVRSRLSTPIIMLTAKDTELDKVLGLELGADDYVTKPFGTRELLARVKAHLRRQRKLDEPRGERSKRRSRSGRDSSCSIFLSIRICTSSTRTASRSTSRIANSSSCTIWRATAARS